MAQCPYATPYKKLQVIGLIDHVATNRYFFAAGRSRAATRLSPAGPPGDGNIILGYFFVCAVQQPSILLNQTLVPMEKKSTTRENSSMISITAGTSTIIPTCGCPFKNVARSFERINTLHHYASCLQELFQGKDHGKHYFRSQSTPARQNSSDLLSEDVFILQRKSDGTQTQGKYSHY